MRIFVAGVSGVIGRRLILILVQASHSLVGMTRSPGRKPALRAELGTDTFVAGDGRIVAQSFAGKITPKR